MQVLRLTIFFGKNEFEHDGKNTKTDFKLPAAANYTNKKNPPGEPEGLKV
jgi:hypothetical protein